MQLSIVGCPDKVHFRPFVKRAAIFYAEQLLSKKLMENIYLKIRFDSKLDVYGYASVGECNDSGKPREFIVELNPNIGARRILETLAHEMVHVKQFALCETNQSLTRWKGIRIKEDDYYVQPWEVEAFGLEVGLFTKFAIKESLWEVFDEICNPDSPIIKSEIGWKVFSPNDSEALL